ncbi:MAG: 50S ribosomal protein L9 [Deltaproteobacteria bacterium]|nr:50S ribosomal protein L9 [Deltaproteobacteria bacterium]
MEVILKEEIKSLGKAGEIVKVKEGYARNFLLPRGKAVQADKGNLKELEHNKRSVQARQTKLKGESEQLASKLAKISVTIKREVGEGDKLFGSVTNKDIADALREEKVLLDKRQIELVTPLKEIGEFDVSVRLHAEVTGVLKVRVVKG